MSVSQNAHLIASTNEFTRSGDLPNFHSFVRSLRLPPCPSSKILACRLSSVNEPLEEEIILKQPWRWFSSTGPSNVAGPHPSPQTCCDAQYVHQLLTGNCYPSAGEYLESWAEFPAVQRSSGMSATVACHCSSAKILFQFTPLYIRGTQVGMSKQLFLWTIL